MKNAPYCSFAPAHHWMNARCKSIALSLHHLLLLLLTCAFIRHTWGVSFFSLSSRAARVDAPPIRKAASFKVDPGPEALTDWETLFLSTLSVVSWRLWQEGFQSGVRGPPTGPTERLPGEHESWSSLFFFFFPHLPGRFVLEFSLLLLQWCAPWCISARNQEQQCAHITISPGRKSMNLRSSDQRAANINVRKFGVTWRNSSWLLEPISFLQRHAAVMRAHCRVRKTHLSLTVDSK